MIQSLLILRTGNLLSKIDLSRFEKLGILLADAHPDDIGFINKIPGVESASPDKLIAIFA